MSRFRCSPSLAIAVLALLIAMTGTAAAAGLTHVVIQNGSNSAAVDKVGQLLMSEAAPGQYVFALSGFADDSNGNTRCKPAYHVPAGKALCSGQLRSTSIQPSIATLGTLQTWRCTRTRIVRTLLDCLKVEPPIRRRRQCRLIRA